MLNKLKTKKFKINLRLRLMIMVAYLTTFLNIEEKLLVYDERTKVCVS